MNPYIQSLGINRFWGEMGEDEKNMNELTHKEQMTAIHHWVTKQRAKCVVNRNKETNLSKKIMLGGKVKAYTDVACLIESRFGKHLL